MEGEVMGMYKAVSKETEGEGWERCGVLKRNGVEAWKGMEGLKGREGNGEVRD